MENIYLEFDQDVPQYICSGCSSCHSVYGKSLCSVKNRGCCWYFPKFTLHEIHKMAKSLEGISMLDDIRKLPGTSVYNYYMHAKGYFDEKGYNKFLENGDACKYDIEDKSIFFRLCPFVKSGKGCNLPVKYRSYVCNFFICREVMEKAEEYASFKDYIKERDNYVRWIEWQNYSLEAMLKEKGLTLAGNFDEVIETLKDIPLDQYEFSKLSPIETTKWFDVSA